MPVHLKIEEFNYGAPFKVILDKTIVTDHIRSGFDRRITYFTLEPGKYHIEIQKFQEIALHDGVMSGLRITSP